MSDRELLHLSAKAARLRVKYEIENMDDECTGLCVKVDGLPKFSWNPLTDDGDRYRLAQRLRISIDYEDCCAWTRKHGDLIQEFWGGDCPDEAHVIVGVAAEIGRRMP